MTVQVTTDDSSIDSAASALSAGLGAWLPIETAPKDGTLILGATRNGSVYAVAYDDIFAAPWRVINDFGLNAGALTHWMPAPEAPNAEFSGGAPLHGAASAGTKGYTSGEDNGD